MDFHVSVIDVWVIAGILMWFSQESELQEMREKIGILQREIEGLGSQVPLGWCWVHDSPGTLSKKN